MAEATATKTKTPRAKKTEGDFAVIATGGKQYLVGVGNKVKIEKLKGDFKVGDAVTFDSVLLSGTGTTLTFGEPFVKGAYVTGKISKIGRNKTIDVIKYKQKSRYFKKYGHRQPFYEVTIETIK